MSQVQRGKVDGNKPTLGWLVDSALPEHVLEGRFYSNLLKGANERAGQLGYSLECFRANDGKVSFQRLGGVLRSRGIRGLVVGPVSSRFPDNREDFPFGEFASSTIGYSLRRPVLHRVGVDYSQGMQLVWQKLREAGFTRPGLLLSSPYDARTNFHLRGMYLALQSSSRAVEVIPPCLAERAHEDGEVIRQWISEYRPDVVLYASSPGSVRELVPSGIDFPHPFIYWINHDRSLPVPGILQPESELGKVALDLVVGQIHRNEVGIPSTPNLTLIPYQWVDPRP